MRFNPSPALVAAVIGAVALDVNEVRDNGRFRYVETSVDANHRAGARIVRIGL
jgi:hypothetical protein